MWAALARMAFEDGFYVFVFDETYNTVVKVKIIVKYGKGGGEYTLTRSGIAVGSFISYGPVDLTE